MCCCEEAAVHVDYDGMQTGFETFRNENGGFVLMAGDDLVPILGKRLDCSRSERTHLSSKMLNGSNAESSGQLIVDIVVVQAFHGEVQKSFTEYL
jgi:hypothetical protein